MNDLGLPPETEQKSDPFTLSYSDLMAALMLVFVLLLSAALLRIKEEEERKEEQANRITLIKDEIITELEAAFREEGITISVDPHSGAITFKEEDIRFASGSHDLLPEGMTRLDQVIPVYLNVLMNPELSDDVTQIMVEGHTDPQPFEAGGRYPRYETAYLDNLGLSMLRAQSVVSYMLSMELDSIGTLDNLPNIVMCSDRLKGLLTATGASFSRPLDFNGEPMEDVPYESIQNGTFDRDTSLIDFDRSRRVEITFRLNDEEYLKDIRELLSEE
jgi:chemotaxis protein MotB